MSNHSMERIQIDLLLQVGVIKGPPGSNISLNDKIHFSHTPGLRQVSRDPSRSQFSTVDQTAVETHGIDNDEQLVGKVDLSNPNRRKSGFCSST